MKILQRSKIYYYNGEPYRVNSTFLKRKEIHYYWCYNLITKEFLVLHKGLVTQ